MHVTLYRKYRPKGFEEIAGQESIVKTLKASLRSGKMSHAYLFSGSRGLGKTTIARLIAKGVNCLNKGITDEPCNECANCIAINEGTFADMIEIDAASNRGINEIREIKDKINYQPSNGRKKIYIIDEAHMLTKEAFNALLKTLEEPPEHVIFILATTEPDKILPTIISRCQRYNFKPVSVEKMSQRLEYICQQENIKYEPNIFPVIYENAGGGMRDSISILERLMLSCFEEKITLTKCEEILGLTSHAQMQDFLDKLLKEDISEVMKTLDGFWRDSVEIEDFFKDFAKFCKNKMENNELEISKGLNIIGCIYDSINKFKFEEDKRLVGYVIIDEILNKNVEIIQQVIETKVENTEKTNSEEMEDINISLEDVKNKWNEVIAEGEKENVMFKIFFKDAKPYKVDKNILYIAFEKKDDFFKENMEKKSNNDVLLAIIHNKIHPKLLLKYITLGIKKEKKSSNSALKEIEDFFGGNII